METANDLLEDFVQHLVKIGLIDANDTEDLITEYWGTFH